MIAFELFEFKLIFKLLKTYLDEFDNMAGIYSSFELEAQDTRGCIILKFQVVLEVILDVAITEILRET